MLSEFSSSINPRKKWSLKIQNLVTTAKSNTKKIDVLHTTRHNFSSDIFCIAIDKQCRYGDTQSYSKRHRKPQTIVAEICNWCPFKYLCCAEPNTTMAAEAFLSFYRSCMWSRFAFQRPQTKANWL